MPGIGSAGRRERERRRRDSIPRRGPILSGRRKTAGRSRKDTSKEMSAGIQVRVPGSGREIMITGVQAQGSGRITVSVQARGRGRITVSVQVQASGQITVSGQAKVRGRITASGRNQPGAVPRIAPLTRRPGSRRLLRLMDGGCMITGAVRMPGGEVNCGAVRMSGGKVNCGAGRMPGRKTLCGAGPGAAMSARKEIEDIPQSRQGTAPVRREAGHGMGRAAARPTSR